MYSEICRGQQEINASFSQLLLYNGTDLLIKGKKCEIRCRLKYLSKKRFLNPPLHQPGKVSVVFHIQMSGDYRGAEW